MPPQSPLTQQLLASSTPTHTVTHPPGMYVLHQEQQGHTPNSRYPGQLNPQDQVTSRHNQGLQEVMRHNLFYLGNNMERWSLLCGGKCHAQQSISCTSAPAAAVCWVWAPPVLLSTSPPAGHSSATQCTQCSPLGEVCCWKQCTLGASRSTYAHLGCNWGSADGGKGQGTRSLQCAAPG